MGPIKIHNGGNYAHAQLLNLKAVKVGFVVCKGVFVAYIFIAQISARSYDTFGMILIFALNENETIPQ